MTEPLKITTSPREDRQLDMTIELGPERTEEALHRAARQVAKRANIPGFRRGKAPYQTVLRTYGRETLLNEIVDDLGREVYQEALETENIEPYAQAQLADFALDPLTFKLVVPLAPEVDLADYRSVRVEEPQVSVTDEDVEGVIAEQRSSRATWVEIDRAAQMGDTVTLDIHGQVGDDAIMDNHDWDLVLKEEAGWLPGFAEAFVGMKAGEDKVFTLRYPEDSSSRYKGQEAEFQATVKQVKARLEPELNDEFAKSLGDYEGVDDLRAKVREGLLNQRNTEAENKLTEDALAAIIGQAHLSYPPAAVEQMQDELIEEVRRNVTRSGYSLEDFVRLQGISIDDYRERLRPGAEKRLQGRLVLSKLAQVEKIEVTPEEIAAEIERLAPAASDNERAQTLRETLQSEGGQFIVEQDVLSDKTLVRLREIVTGRAPELPANGEQPAGETVPVEGLPAEAAAVTEGAPAGQGQPDAGSESTDNDAGTAVAKAAVPVTDSAAEEAGNQEGAEGPQAPA